MLLFLCLGPKKVVYIFEGAFYLHKRCFVYLYIDLVL